MSWIQGLQPKHIQTLVPYASAGRSNLEGEIWLNANENPYERGAGGLSSSNNRYPQFQPAELLKAYANYAGCSTEQLIVTRGIDEGIDLLIRAFCEPGKDSIVYTPPTYGMYDISAKTLGVKTIAVPLKSDFGLDVEALETTIQTGSKSDTSRASVTDSTSVFGTSPDIELAEMSGTINQGMEISGASASGTPPDIELAEMPGVLDQEMEASASSATELATDTEPAEVPSPTPKLIFLCSPNNPTGNLLNREDVLKVLEMAEGKSIVILDEAYIEFNPEASFINDLTEYDNLVVARTLSKAFGLAGLRTGFLIANPEIISILQKVSAPYPIPVPIVEMATEALNNEGVSRMKSEVKAIIQSRSTLEAALNDLEFVKQVYPGDANFLLLEVADVQEVMNYLKSRGIIIRDQSHQLNLENCIRISIGTEAEQAELLKVLKNYGEQA